MYHITHATCTFIFLDYLRIIRNFEVISEEVVANPESADINIPLENIAFSSVMVSRAFQHDIIPSIHFIHNTLWITSCTG